MGLTDRDLTDRGLICTSFLTSATTRTAPADPTLTCSSLSACTDVLGTPISEAPVVVPAYSRREEALKIVFVKLDVDHSGFIEVVEFKTLLAKAVRACRMMCGLGPGALCDWLLILKPHPPPFNLIHSTPPQFTICILPCVAASPVL